MDKCDGPFPVGDYRDMVRDLVACSDFSEFCLRLGLVPSGPDVDLLEHRRHHARVAAIQPIVPAMNDAAALAARVIHDIFHSVPSDENDEPDEDEDDDAEECDTSQVLAISQLAATATILHLVAQGKLAVTCTPRLS
jgi:hypothetical protein